MSGLAVLVHRDGRPADQAAIQAMLAAVPYRGPDGMWVRLFDSVALGYAKMAVTPEEEFEQLPLVSPRTGCAIIADVRLDNRTDLLERLPGRLPITMSDAELILRAYETWGADAVVHLLGDFAFVLWDPRDRRLVCARDTGGQRSLFYRLDAHVFAAASEIQQLFQDPAVAVEPNEETIRNFLVPYNLLRNQKDQMATFYEGIYALPAGHVMTIDREAVHVRRYWEVTPPAELRYRTDEQYAEHFRSLFFDVVQSRLRSLHPIGAMLSGGIDSSSVVCTAQELYRAGRAEDRGFTSFSMVFDGLKCDERHLIQDVEAKYGFDARYVQNSAYRGWLRLEPQSFQLSPLTRVSEIHAVYSVAIQTGVRVLLSGDIADNCVRGSRLVFDSLLRQAHLGEFRRHLQAYRRVSKESLRRIIGLYCLTPLLPLELQKRLMYGYVRRVLQRKRNRLLPEWISGPLREELSDEHVRLCLEAEGARRFPNYTRQLEYNNLYPPEIGWHPIGWPLEIWRPYADRRLHEFLLAIPPEQKFAPHPETDELYAGSKQIVRNAMHGIMPESIRTRTVPTHYASVFASEVQQKWHLYEEAFHPSRQSEIAARGYIDPQRFWSRLQELRAAREYGNDFIYVTRMAALETWLRTIKLPRPQRVTVPPLWGDAPSSMGIQGTVLAPVGGS